MSGILTLNAGSSSMKFGLYHDAEEPEELLQGEVDDIGDDTRLILETPHEKRTVAIHAATQQDALSAVMDALVPFVDGLPVIGVGHRIVHGGPDFTQSTILTPKVLQECAFA